MKKYAQRGFMLWKTIAENGTSAMDVGPVTLYIISPVMEPTLSGCWLWVSLNSQIKASALRNGETYEENMLKKNSTNLLKIKCFSTIPSDLSRNFCGEISMMNTNCFVGGEYDFKSF
jgi:hypothetical protein